VSWRIGIDVKTSGSKKVRDGAYQLLQSDGAYIFMVRDSDGHSTLGWLAKNNGSGGLAIALGMKACEQGVRTLFSSATALIAIDR